MKIEFCPIRRPDEANKIKSTGDTIRLCILHRTRKGKVIFRGDWFGVPLDLCLSALKQLENAWRADMREYPVKGDFACTRANLLLTVQSSQEQHWRQVLGDLLSNDNSWVFLRRAA